MADISNASELEEALMKSSLDGFIFHKGINEYVGGFQVILRFGNNYGVSIIRNFYSYGGREGYYELAPLHFRRSSGNYDVCPDKVPGLSNDYYGDPYGWQTLEQVIALCKKICPLYKSLDKITPDKFFDSIIDEGD